MPYFDEPGVRYDDPRIRFDDPRTFQEILQQEIQPPMFKVAVDISHITPLQLIDRAKSIRNGIASRPVFSSLAPKLTALDGLVETLGDKQGGIATAQATVKVATTQRDTAEDAVIAALNELGIEVGKLAATEEDVTATTMHVVGAATPKPKVAPDKPTDFALTIGDHAGGISGQCHGQPGRVDYYEYRFTTGDPTSPATAWPFSTSDKKSHFAMDGLPSGQIIWGQARACNSHGKSEWSDPATVRVP
jgi:hypothetical protein